MNQTISILHYVNLLKLFILPPDSDLDLITYTVNYLNTFLSNLSKLFSRYYFINDIFPHSWYQVAFSSLIVNISIKDIVMLIICCVYIELVLMSHMSLWCRHSSMACRSTVDVICLSYCCRQSLSSAVACHHCRKLNWCHLYDIMTVMLSHWLSAMVLTMSAWYRWGYDRWCWMLVVKPVCLWQVTSSASISEFIPYLCQISRTVSYSITVNPVMLGCKCENVKSY